MRMMEILRDIWGTAKTVLPLSSPLSHDLSDTPGHCPQEAH